MDRGGACTTLVAMCGRFVSASPPDEIAAYFEASVSGDQALEMSYNVAPTDDIYAVTLADGERRLETFHWGLVPPWAESPAVGSRMINARAETIATKGAFRPALESRRCLVPADGFYEWMAIEGRTKKQPLFIHARDGHPLAFAGLWETWSDRANPGAGSLHSCTIITTRANGVMAPVHDRMPAILAPSVWNDWLAPAGDLDALRALLVPAADEVLEMHRVATDVGNVRNDGAHLIDPFDDTDAPSADDASKVPGQGSLL